MSQYDLLHFFFFCFYIIFPLVLFYLIFVAFIYEILFLLHFYATYKQQMHEKIDKCIYFYKCKSGVRKQNNGLSVSHKREANFNENI